MVRLLKFLKLNRISQVSFAEYHSKRNFVERVHAEENRVLSKHGPFNSQPIHKSAITGSVQHRENMEEMAGEVQKCVSTATFGGQSLLCNRGARDCDFIFDDETALHNLMGLNEERKREVTDKTYEIVKNEIAEEVNIIWGTDLNFKGSYTSDYKIISNELQDEAICWSDKYTTVLQLPTPASTQHLQPIPDYIRWINTCEFHYMPWQERKALESGVWDEQPGLFIPSAIMDYCFIVLPQPPLNIMKLIAILAWLPLGCLSRKLSNTMKS